MLKCICVNVIAKPLLTSSSKGPTSPVSRDLCMSSRKPSGRLNGDACSTPTPCVILHCSHYFLYK